MLVDNKFLYISLPRCASTSFMVSCIKNDISTNYFDEVLYNQLTNINKELSSEELAYILRHSHETCADLQSKFGKKYDVISVKRNRYERFISTWEHVIDELEKREEYTTADIFKQMDENDLLVYSSDDIHQNNLIDYINGFLNTLNIKTSNKNNRDYLINMMWIVISPTSIWHNHNPKIIWFDFKKLSELEDWVSNKLNKPFKLEKINSSKHIECNLKLTDGFIKKYNEIYDIYDFKKEIKTLI